MGNQQISTAKFLVVTLQDLQYRIRGKKVQSTGDFIQHQKLRMNGEGPEQRKAALFAARELTNRNLKKMGVHVGQLHQFIDSRPPLPLVQLRQVA